MTRRLFTLALALLLSGGTALHLHAQLTLDFEDAGLALDTFARADASDTARVFTFGPDVAFASTYTTEFGGFWTGGWAVSTSRNDSVGDFTNLYGSAPGSGAGGSATYLVGFNTAEVDFGGEVRLMGFDYTNTAYTAEVVENGSGFSDPFGLDSLGQPGAPDSLMLDVTLVGRDSARSFSVALADYRGSEDEDFVVRDWRTVLLESSPTEPLPVVTAVRFSLTSSERGMFGNNTPNFFALDNLRFEVMPISTHDAIQATDFGLYPNPSSREVVLSHRTVRAGELAVVTVRDFAGRVVLAHPAYAVGAPLDLSSLAPGTYAVSLATRDAVGAAVLVKR